MNYLHLPGCSRLYSKHSLFGVDSSYAVCCLTEYHTGEPYWKIEIFACETLFIPFSFEEHFGMLDTISQAHILKAYV